MQCISIASPHPILISRHHFRLLYFFFSNYRNCYWNLHYIFCYSIRHPILLIRSVHEIAIAITEKAWGPSLSWSHGSSIYNYLCNQYLTLWVRYPLRGGVLDTTLCYKVCQWLAANRWFSLSTPVSSYKKTDRNDITEILLKVTLNTITPS